jgi:hypothetical protein
MDNVKLHFEHLIPKNAVIGGIEVCCDCGGSDTTLLTYGIYCQTCRKFRDFIKKNQLVQTNQQVH